MQTFKTFGLRGVVAVIALLAVVATGLALAPTATPEPATWATAWASVGVGFGWCVRFMGPGVIFTLALFEIRDCGRRARAKKSNTQEPQQ